MKVERKLVPYIGSIPDDEKDTRYMICVPTKWRTRDINSTYENLLR